jgi:hypothetical protein
MATFAFQLADQQRRTASSTAQGQPARPPKARLEVIGAGFGRTGTMSLKLALEQLGFGPCYHMTDIVNNPLHARLWRAADAGHRVDWTELFVRYRATVDWHACHHYRELMQEFPEAKVILTIRDPDQWYDSMANTLYSLTKAMEAHWLGKPALGGIRAPYVEHHIWRETFSGRFEDRQYATMVFQRHNAEVIDCVPAERLLVYQVAEGWRPLCEFLGVPQPDGAFPRINTTQSFREYNSYQLGIG